jgi:hypothetical protein
MTQIAIGHTFMSAMAKLDSAAAGDTATFLRSLVQDPDSALFEAWAGRAAEDTAQTLRVTEDLRAVARRDGSMLLLLFIGHCNAAYDWAASNCFGNDLPRAGRRLAVGEIPGADVPGLMALPLDGAWYCPIANSYDLSRALEAAGIDHGLSY